MSAEADDLVPCQLCYDGEWFTECCSGAGGCSCRGQIISMGRCNVCNGTGYRQREADTRANIHTIEGYGYIGSGPRGGLFDSLPRMGRRP